MSENFDIVELGNKIHREMCELIGMIEESNLSYVYVNELDHLSALIKSVMNRIENS